MRYSWKTRILSMLLAAVMVIGLVPESVFAAETEQETDVAATPETVQETIAEEQTGEAEGTEDEPTAEQEETQAPTEGSQEPSEETTPETGEEEAQEQEAEESETPAEPVTASYQVQHYLQNAEGGYDLDADATEELTGEAGAATAAAAKTYEGYEAQAFEQAVVAEDGSTVVKIYYNAVVEAVSEEASGSLPSYMTVIQDKESTLAPGITMNEIVAYDGNGERVEMYLTTTDLSVGTVEFYANYKDNQNSSWGMQTLSEQVAAIEANYEEPFKVVAGINASYYNTSTGAPTGAFVMEGVDMSTSGDSYSFFAVLKDGTVMIGAKGEYSSYKGQIKEAIGGWIHLVHNGAVCSGLDATTKYPRQTIGITADGKVITMTADGSQAPQTVGLTIQEQAEVMLALGCVEAIHLDGGNSATFGAVCEGEDSFTLVNSPSGGAERAVSNTLMIVSTAVADGTFDHAVITSDYNYFVPNSAYTFSAFGVDASNAPAQIPETAVWTLSDDSFGTIENGTFISNGTLGEVNIQLTDNGKVVGTKTVNVVTPTSISFTLNETTVPYGETAALTVTAMYGNSEAFCTADAFNWTVDPEAAGTMDGFRFTAGSDETVTSAVVTAAYKYDETVASASITVKFGKGSEVLFDFEDGDISDWQGVDTISEWIDDFNAAHPGAKYPLYQPANYGNSTFPHTSSVFLATESEGGKVKSGDYALGVKLDRLYADGVGSWIYNYLFYTGDTQIWRDVANGKGAVRVGLWVNMPQNASNTAFRICRTFTKDSTGKLYSNYDYMYSDYDGKKVSYNTDYSIPESGWMYVYFDLTAYDFQSSLQFSETESYAINNGKGADGDYYPAFIQFINGDRNDTMEEVVIYIDDITLDYSEVTEDRDAPVISSAAVCSDTANFVALDGQTVTGNLLSFSASITDDSGNSNTTGLDYSTAKIYVDGVDMSGKSGFKASGSAMSLTDVYLTDGTHSVAFVICDNQGNETRVTKTLTVNGTAGNSVVTLTGHNDGDETPKAGSVYYIDVKVSDASQISSIVTTLKLNTANAFEYSHVICAEGVTAVCSYDALNYELTLTITHDGSQTGEAVLVSVPVRVWAWDEAATGISASTQFATGNIPVIDIECKTTLGKVTYADGAYSDYIAGFYTALDIATELDNSTAWHSHSAYALEDVDAACGTDGYTGRTYCDGCHSVISWGTTVPATGHSYEVTDGVLKCACGALFTGVYTDGKTYVDGVAQSDGWSGNSYYKDGVKLTGVQKVPAPDGSGDEYYYDFGEDGVCENQLKYEGLFYDEAGAVYRYSKLGVVSSGWFSIDGEWYYFEAETMAAATGTYPYSGDVVYEFAENGRLISGFWAKTLYGTRYYYGPGYYKTGWVTIEGKEYFFENSYRVEGGCQCVFENQVNANWYYFGEDGSCDRDYVIPDGFYTDRNGLGYSRNGVGLQGVNLIDGVFYYFNTKGYAQTGSYGGYLFGEDYKAYTGLLEENGTTYYYRNGKPYVAGLVEIDGAYYFVCNGDGSIAVNETRYVWQGNGIIPESNREFGPDGKMLDGIVEKDGTLYYYVMGQARTAGLVEVDGAYYFARGSKGEIAAGETCYVWQGNGIIPESTREFGTDGKMLDGIVEKNGGYYYYEMGQPKMAGLLCIDGDYYFARNGEGQIVTNQTYYVWKSNDLLPEGNYQFDEEGKMRDGIVEIDGVYYYYVNGKPKTAGLVEVDGGYYFARGSKGEIAVNQTCYVWQGNGIIPESTREFGADGKMLDGIVEKEGVLYYYVMGQPRTAGMVEVDGDYYFARGSKGEVATSGSYYVWQGNGIIPESNREFGADGKLLDGIVEKDGVLYYYVMGQPRTAGMVEVDGDYYFARGSKGEIAVNGRYYVWQGNGIIPESNREFGADGKLLDGFITRDDGIYYYEDGVIGTVGLNYIDGYYYFVGTDGKLVTNRTYYVWKTNGLTVAMNYTFDELGRIVL